MKSTTLGDTSRTGRSWARFLAAATTVLLMLLVVAACERADAPEAADSEDASRFADVGPDWGIVQEYLDWKALPKASRDAATGDAPEGQDAERTEEAPPEPPDINRAAAAARAIVDQDGAHEKTLDAAAFLVNLVRHNPMTINEPETDQHVVAAAKALATHAPDYQDWPQVLSQMNVFKRFEADGTSSRPETDTFLEEMASEAESPALRAASRYYLAAALIEAANLFEASPEDREARRTRALDLASGLSAGVEDGEFRESPADSATTKTFAEAEASLIRTIRHATIGGTLPELTAARLDGSDDRFGDYRGRVLLINFWATWCKPCVAALPKLRELAADSPDDRFALLSISVDRALETVTTFQEDEPMPWANWHDPNDEVVDPLAVSSYPTYILADEHGEILARTNSLSEEFLSMLQEALVVESAR